MWNLLLVLLFVIFFLFIKHIQLLFQLKKMTLITKEIQTGSLNLRYRLRTSQKDVKELAEALNQLMDHFQVDFERIEFLEEERKRMVANISHDLRTPLTSLLGYIEAMRNDPTLTTKEKGEFLQIITNKGNSLLKLLQDFFELAKLEANDFKLNLQKIDLVQIISEVLVGFYPVFVKADIVPVINMPDEPFYVKADVDCLHRILNNFLSNALRYGYDGKEIGVGLREEGDLVWVDVWDKGKGISKEDIPYVFERLYTGSVSRNTSTQGTGLGLTIAKNLVEKHGGKITVTSAPNEKTIFSFGFMRN
ncbi:sensor histidine kinase [Shimazuella alba]|uniref:histidine kinase n=1 Tax=Shimazuella alba TaxID=2690964 RepID=A0A6I4VRF2_9BACL|nr:HAMP domain-containing sensor histidine kinase [Shimazuella alba]MXQ54237.1 sensor histidine kinase [Shimazuella alba]